MCYFDDGIANLEGHHCTMSLEASCKTRDGRWIVVVIRGRTKHDYRTSFDAGASREGDRMNRPNIWRDCRTRAEGRTRAGGQHKRSPARRAMCAYFL
jgi:hypothetical protein